jgi:hypothetical protein
MRGQLLGEEVERRKGAVVWKIMEPDAGQRGIVSRARDATRFGQQRAADAPTSFDVHGNRLEGYGRENGDI